MDMRKIEYALYPSKKQALLLQQHLDLHRALYNAALEERISAYCKSGISITYNDQQASFTVIRAECPEYKALPIFSARMTLRRLDKAYKAFFRRAQSGQKGGFPRFKSKSRFHSFELIQHGKDWQFLESADSQYDRLTLKGIGTVRCKGKARTQGTPKAASVLCKRGRWYLSLTVECVPLRQTDATQACGIDWGVEHLLTITEPDGTFRQVPNPRWYCNQKTEQLALEHAIARKKRGSRGEKKARRALADFRAKTARQRKDHHHKLSTALVNEYALIAGEKLTVRNMTRSAKGTVEQPGKQVKQKSGLNREILDTAPGMLISLIRYKAVEAGSVYQDTPTRKLKPSQRCPACWTVKKKTLDERVHDCACGFTMPRDAASAWVNVKWALDELAGPDTVPEGRPSETPTSRAA